MSTKVYLELAIDDIVYESLGNWKYPYLTSFSVDKDLFKYQIDAVKNAVCTLNLYYKESIDDPNKNTLYDLCLNKGMSKGQFNKYENDSAFKALTKNNYYNIECNGKHNYINEVNFFNRMCFWMATASGKTLVLIKIIEIVNYYIKNNLMPKNDFLVLLPDENALDQLKKAVNEYNVDKDITIKLESLKNYDEKKNLISYLNEIVVWTYRTDLLSDDEKTKKIDIFQYENGGHWYVLMDEAHKGESNSSTRKNYVDIMSRNGFLFNFSATFTDDIDYATTCYNFNLERFINSGFGKKIYLSESTFNFSKKKDDLSSSQKQIEVLKSLIMLSILKDQKKEGYYHNPLMITLVDKVQGENSDISIFFNEVASIANGKCKENIFERAKNELLEEFICNKDFAIGDGKLDVEFKKNIKTITLKKVLKNVFNANKSGDIEILEGEKNKELALKLASSDIAFALIRIGETAEYIKTHFKGKYIINKNYDSSKRFFAEINKASGQHFNIVIGSRMFYEGWDSNRPNIINYINIGQENAKKYVLQSVGRGVRIQPIENDFSNRRRLDEGDKNKNQLLETLFIFATNKEAINKVLSTLDTEVENGISCKEIELKTNTRILDLIIPEYKLFDKSIEDIEIKNFRISNNSLEFVRNYYKSLSDSLLLLNHGVDKKFINKTRELIDDSKSFKRDEKYAYVDMRYLVDKLFNAVKSKDCKINGFKRITNEIVHFKHIKVSKECYEDIKSKISIFDKSNAKKVNLKSLAKELIDGKITEDELKNIIEVSKNKNDQSYRKLNFTSLSEHYYTPLIMTEDEKVDYINHIIKYDSEIDFINCLSKHLNSVTRKGCFKWMFSKIDETIDKDMGMPYTNQEDIEFDYFYPDFIFWLEKGNKYKIIFVDPKGKSFANYQLKVDGFIKLFRENELPKKFKYNDYEITVDLKLINKNPNGISQFYIDFWAANDDFSWLNI